MRALLLGQKGGTAHPAQGVLIVFTGSATDMNDFKLCPLKAFTRGFPTAITVGQNALKEKSGYHIEIMRG